MKTLPTYLHDQGYKATPARIAVFDALTAGPRSAARLANDLAPLLDRATVYRTVDLFRTLSIVEEHVRNGRRQLELTDEFRPHHHHFWCTDCSQLTDFDSEALEQAIATAASQLGSLVTAHQVEMSGICRLCLAKRQATTV